MSILDYEISPHANRHLSDPKVEAAIYDYLTTDVPYETIVRASGVSRQALYSLGIKVFRRWVKDGLVTLDPKLLPELEANLKPKEPTP